MISRWIELRLNETYLFNPTRYLPGCSARLLSKLYGSYYRRGWTYKDGKKIYNCFKG